MQGFDGFLQTYEEHLDDPEWLSRSIVMLSAILYSHNTQMAKAELAESQAMVTLLEQIKEGKKMAVSEAQTRAQVETNNFYHELKVTGEAIVETINSIKKRLDVLSWERKAPHYG